MSSHREAPETSKDPVADNTDVYAFVSPDRPDTVTLIANFIPFQNPAGGPNFYEFGDDVRYRINVDNSGDGVAKDIIYEFRFETTVPNENTFLYNTGPIESIDSPNFNRPQRCTVTEIRGESSTVIGEDLLLPPCNVGLRSTPNYPDLANSAIYEIGDGIRLFAGQRLDGFFVDLGSIFDLAALRPVQNLHLISTPAAAGVNGLRGFNVHSIALQIPISQLTSDGSVPTDPLADNAVIGVYAAADRQKGRFQDATQSYGEGPFTQVSRLAVPLFNEVLVPMARKDAEPLGAGERFRLRPARGPAGAGRPAGGVVSRRVPEPGCIRPGSCRPTGGLPDRLSRGRRARLPEQHGNHAGRPPALERRHPAECEAQRERPRRRRSGGLSQRTRVFDDIVTVELRAVAGLTIPLVDPSYVPDEAASLIKDGTQELGDTSYLNVFPYLDHPVSGYDSVPPSASGLPQGR
ncbi:MAG: DUF4331 domain-containing protein [Ilumatobacteraceae bacterium]